MKWYEILILLWYGIGALLSLVTANIKFFMIWVISLLSILLIFTILEYGGVL
nr:MAG TPA: hypothetical protein [Caudoviricetes sp.]